MNMDRVSFGIELTIAGLFWIMPFAFLFMAISNLGVCHFSCGSFYRLAWRNHDVIRKEYLPYLAIALTAFSYLMGIIADIATKHPSFLFDKRKREKLNKDNPHADEKLVTFLRKASPELVQEFNARRGRNMLLRVVGFSLWADSITSSIWLETMHKCNGVNPVVFLVFAFALFGWIILKILFVKSYQKYDEFRDLAFDLCQALHSEHQEKA